MGSSPRPRAMSPPDKPVIDPMRASTGTMQLSASYNEPYDPHTSRHGHSSSQSTADVSYANSYEPRLSRSQRLEAHPVSSTYRSPDQSTTKLRTEYAIRPRQRSSTTSAADGRHPPLRVTVSPSVPHRGSPIITPSYNRSSSPWTADPGYLVPASPHHGHRRLYYTNDGRLTRPRGRHGEYHTESGNRRRYPASRGFRKDEDIDDWDAYSYTKPEEWFGENSVDRLGRGRGYRHSRPLSLTGTEDHSSWMLKKEPRAHGPPPSQRGFDKLDARTRRSTYDSDRESTGSQPSYRVPVSLHQDWDDGYYSSYRDGHHDDGHRHRRRRHHHHHHHDSHDDDYRSLRGHSHTGSASESVAGTGLGTAVMASGYESDWADYPYGYDYTKHRSRSRRPARRHGTEADAYTSDDDLRAYQHETSARRESPSSNESPPEAQRTRRTSRSRIPVPDGHSSRQVSSSSQEDIKKPNDSNSPKESEPQIKSILKTPRDKFPEEPNPVREGVAPLKDAHKKGIPPDARWTKIDRRLVNPAALKAGKERFEDRPEYVIVLRVLSKEEIQAYAIKTQEIRGNSGRIPPFLLTG